MSFFCATNPFPRTSANIAALLLPPTISCLCWSTNKELAPNRTPMVGCREGVPAWSRAGSDLRGGGSKIGVTSPGTVCVTQARLCLLGRRGGLYRLHFGTKSSLLQSTPAAPRCCSAALSQSSSMLSPLLPTPARGGCAQPPPTAAAAPDPQPFPGSSAGPAGQQEPGLRAGTDGDDAPGGSLVAAPVPGCLLPSERPPPRTLPLLLPKAGTVL